MDSNGKLRQLTEEEMIHLDNLKHPVESTADIPVFKLKMFELIDKQGNRKARKKYAKAMNIEWSEYQIYRQLKSKTVLSNA